MKRFVLNRCLPKFISLLSISDFRFSIFRPAPAAILYLLLISTYACTGSGTYRSDDRERCDSVLSRLDYILTQDQSRTDDRRRRIDKLSKTVTDRLQASELYALYDSLYNAYYAYQFDSTYSYLEKKIAIARQLSDKNILDKELLQRARMNVGIGQYELALSELNKIDPQTLDRDNRIRRHEVFAYLYNNMKYNSRDSEYASYYDSLARVNADSLTALLPESAPLRLEFEESRARERGDLQEALRINRLRWMSVNPESVEAASIAFDRMQIYDALADTVQMLEWAARSAIADVRSDIKDNAAMAVCARILYAGGDIDRAVRYISRSMDDAMFYNTPYRLKQMARMQHLIDGAHAQLLARANRNKVIMVCVSLFLLSVSVVSVLLMMKQVRKVKALNRILHDEKIVIEQLKEKVTDADRVKEQSIKIFLEMSARSSDRLSRFVKSIDVKLAQKKYGEIHDIITGFSDSDLSTDERNMMFDRTFLDMYPCFVEQFNRLLKPDERISLKKNGAMTPELRIFALIRLGIDSSSDIAHLLRYSLSTIYNYRMKIRHKAIDPEKDFDRMVKDIKGYQ
ncbi:MAG: hypothetical protein K2I56_05380 [Muribaculaceae bacterium]|nr:hypothetical protein [Muribaculaceae bacterium]